MSRDNVVCATSKASDQPAHTHSLIRAFDSRINILWLEFLGLKGGCPGSSESALVKMVHWWKSHVAAPILLIFRMYVCSIFPEPKSDYKKNPPLWYYMKGEDSKCVPIHNPRSMSIAGDQKPDLYSHSWAAGPIPDFLHLSQWDRIQGEGH